MDSDLIHTHYLIETIGPADLGLKEEQSDDDRGHGIFGLSQLNRGARWAQPITYLDVYECHNFTVCSSIFLIFLMKSC